VKRQDCGHEQPGLFDTSVFKPGLWLSEDIDAF
jgi:hypothetical protein